MCKGTALQAVEAIGRFIPVSWVDDIDDFIHAQPDDDVS